MCARAFALLGASSLAAVRARLEAQLEAWSSDWGLAELALDVSCVRAWEAATVPAPACPAATIPVERYFAGDAGCVRVAWPPGMVKALAHAMFPGDQRQVANDAEATIAREAGEQMLASLVESIAGLLTGASEADEGGGAWVAASSSIGSGAVAATVLANIGSGTFRLSCLFDHAAVRALQETPIAAAASPGKLSLIQALRDVSVTLPVTVGEAEIDLASLAALTVGDVIRLETSVDQPSMVRASDGACLLEVFLGRIGRDVAVEVVGRRKSLV
jgi:flagellar motor switch/type III secretory pathway protein FliN